MSTVTPREVVPEVLGDQFQAQVLVAAVQHDRSIAHHFQGHLGTQLRIMRFDPQTKKVETVGIPRVVDFDENKVKDSYARGAKFELRYMQGAAVGPDGSLYVTDDTGGRIYKIVYRGN